MPTNLLTVSMTARLLGVTSARVRALINEGRLPAERLGSQWTIRESDLHLVAERKVGAPIGNKNAAKK